MSVLANLSNLIIPLLIFYIVATGLANRVNVYEEFLAGAKDGMKTVVGIMPTMIGLMIAVGILRASGFLDFVGTAAGKLFSFLDIPAPLFPLIFIKMFSSSAATGLVLDIFKQYGPDSHTGLLTSLIMSSTETIFYTMSVYCMAAKVKKTRYTLPGALFASLAGIIASFILVSFM
jgi:spore maturation protein B